MRIVFPWSDELAEYDLGEAHPLKPERFTLARDLMRAYGLLAEENAGDTSATTATSNADRPRARVVGVSPSPREDLELVHDADYIDAVIEASADPWTFRSRHGIGPGDTPAFHGMHHASALVCGATTEGLRAVVERDAEGAFSVAGGLHHAHRDRAAGFCVYNDPAVAIAVMTRDHPGLRVAYVDIDAHHGDGVQEAFYDRADVLTISVHESGRYLYPGTGRLLETGTGRGDGFAINVPLPPMADDVCYHLVLEEVIRPALCAFAPDVVVAQCGADAHHSDPLTHLGLTVPGYHNLVLGIIAAAEEVCDGRILCTGGGGYSTYSIVPRLWTLVLASLLGFDLPEQIPEEWRTRCEELSGEPAPLSLLQDHFGPLPVVLDQARAETATVISRVRQASPLLERDAG